MSAAIQVPARERATDLGRAALAVIDRDAMGGVSYIARLVELALEPMLAAELNVISLGQTNPGRVSPQRKVRFASQVFAQNALRRVDWLYFAHPGIASAQQLVPAPLRLPYVVQLHGTDAWETPPSRAVQSAMLRIAPSRYTIERAQQAFPEIGLIALCPHGLLPRTVPSGEVDQALLARVGPAAALIVGRVLGTERRKGHDQLLECWPRVRARCEKAQLVIAGDGDDLPRLRRKAEELRISDGVIFCGYVSEATREALMRRAAVFAMPSQQEGFGLVYLEAMRAGLACIGARDDGATEPIVDGVTGLLVTHDDRPELADAIVGLLTNIELRRSLGAAGRQRYASTFTFESYQGRLLALLQERVHQRAPRRA